MELDRVISQRYGWRLAYCVWWELNNMISWVTIKGISMVYVIGGRVFRRGSFLRGRTALLLKHFADDVVLVN